MKLAAITRATIATLVPVGVVACASREPMPIAGGHAPLVATGESIRVLELHPGVTATVVGPALLDPRRPVHLVIYALPNGNTTAETIGRAAGADVGWRHDIQHIGAQTRALRARGLGQVVVAYLEADGRSWPEWRRRRGYDRANSRIVAIVDELRRQVGGDEVGVTLAGHSGGGSFTWGFIDGQQELPPWLERIAFLDANYSFEPRHGAAITTWLRRAPGHTLVVLAYDDREVTIDGRKVVSDSGGTWRATQRMIDDLAARAVSFAVDSIGDVIRYRNPQVEMLMHRNPGNRILHTELVGEMNGYMHALLARRPEYERGPSVFTAKRAYQPWISGELVLPVAVPPEIPPRRTDALGGSAFIASVRALPREAREAAVRRELLTGNIPSLLRRLRTVTVSSRGHAVSYEVMPDYLAIGSDDDFVRMPMTPATAQAFCDAFGFVLPTARMVTQVWAAADVRIAPRPLTVDREAPTTFLQHHLQIESQLGDAPRGSFVAGHKKDVVVTSRLLERPDRVAIFGWHHPNGDPIQPLYTGHVNWYVDYSHGIRPIRRRMSVDGTTRSFESIMADSAIATLLTDESGEPVTSYVP